MTQQVQRFLENTVQLTGGEIICCALSGGADSVCLLRCLLELQKPLHITVTAVHVNHNLRGEESVRDQRFCERLCEQLNVSLQGFSVDVRQRAKQEKCSEELAARLCRYEVFEQVHADWIATAHTASDNLETMLHRLARGSSLHGLAAIPPKNKRFLRPLLAVTRQEIEVYLSAAGQDYVTDSTNLTDAYTRNRIRHQIVPELKRLNPAVERTAVHTLRSLRLEDDYLTMQAKAAYAVHLQGNTLTRLDELHPAIAMRCLAMLLEQCAIAYDAPLLERLYEMTLQGGRWNLTGNVYAAAKQGTLTIETIRSVPLPLAESVLLQMGENCLYEGFTVFVSLIKQESFDKFANVHGKFANCCLDYDKIKGDIFLRPRQYGARMQLCGRNFTASLKKLIQAKVPKPRRDTLHVLTDDEGVIYAEYIGIADRVRPDEHTQWLLAVDVRESNEKNSGAAAPEQNGVI